MKNKHILIITLIFLIAILFTWIYFYEFKGGQIRNEQKEKAKKLFHFAPSEVDSLMISYDDTTLMVLKDTFNNWTITNPLITDADNNYMDGFIITMLDIVYEDTLHIMQNKLSEYGLNPPNYTLSAFLKDNTKQTIYLGDESPTEKYQYAKSPSEDMVLLVDWGRAGGIEKNLFKIRNKRLLDFPIGQIHTIKLELPNNEIIAERKPNQEWWLISPQVLRADKNALIDLMQWLANVYALSIISETKDNLANYGLDKPNYAISMVKGYDENKENICLYLVISPLKTVYAYSSQQTYICEVSNGVINSINKNLYQLRDKNIFSTLDFDNINKIELEYDEKKIIYNRIDDFWYTSNDTISPHQRELDLLLSDLKHTRILGFIDGQNNLIEYGLTSPQQILRLYIKDTEEAYTLYIGNKISNKGVYTSREGINNIIIIDNRIIEPLDLLK